MTLVKKRKLLWFGHVSGSSGLANMILQGKVNGRRRDRRSSGKTILKSGQGWTLPAQLGQLKQDKVGKDCC